MRGMLLSTFIMSILVLSGIGIIHLYKEHDINVFSYLSVLSIDRASHNNASQINDHIENEYEKELPSVGEIRPHYIIKAQLNENQTSITGSMTVKTKIPSSNTIVFNNYPPMNMNNMTIHEVLIYDQEVPFTFTNNQLSISLTELAQISPEFHTDRLVVDISFTTRIPQMGTRFGVKDDIWLLTTWYPILGVKNEKTNQWHPRPIPVGFGDPFYFEHADYDVYLLAPRSIQWVTSGTEVSKSAQDNNLVKYHWQEETIRNFALVGSKHYTIHTLLMEDGVTIQVALVTDKHVQEITEILEHSYPLFKDVFGKLPYQTISVAETSWGTNFALEYPNLAIYSRDLYSQGLLERWLPHEFAHIWWYNAVGNNEISEGWIDEGLVEHAVVLYLEERYGQERGQQMRNYFRNQNKQLMIGNPTMRMNQQLMDFPNQALFFNSWYYRSADMFLTLREELGEIKYNHFLRTLFDSNIGSIIGIHELNRTLQDTIKGNHQYFDDWVNRPFRETPFDLQATPIPLKINGHHIPTEQVHYVDWELYVPKILLDEILFNGIGNPLTTDENNGQIYFNNEILFSLPAVRKNNEILLPLDIIKHVSEHEFFWDFERNIATINVYYFNR